jgi:NADP-dependent 3-hydroxy acid dehydrogenase YdfG
MNPFQSRIAVVTGASAGIGEQLARDLVADGARVVVNARRSDALHRLAAELGPERVEVVAGDAADPEVISALLDAPERRFRAQADLVVVNAGRGLRGSVLDSDTTQWQEMVRTNLLGSSLLMREAARRMTRDWPQPDTPEFEARWTQTVERGGPARDIVILGSTVGRHISPFSSMYGSTKFAVHSLAEALRREMARHGVRVTVIEPGVVRTEFQEAAGYEMIGFGAFMDRVGPVLRAQDISRAILFAVNQPPAVHVNDLMVRPTRQEYP